MKTNFCFLLISYYYPPRIVLDLPLVDKDIMHLFSESNMKVANSIKLETYVEIVLPIVVDPLVDANLLNGLGNILSRSNCSWF
jgi:hypothetical protein